MQSDRNVSLEASSVPEEGGATSAPAEWRDVRELLPWAANPRQITPEAIEKMRLYIREYGWADPCLVRDEDLMLVSGHRRRLAALAELEADPSWQLPDAPAPGMVPVRRMALSATRAHALALVMNRSPDDVAWDDAAVGRVLVELQEEARSGGEDILAALAFDDDELDAFLAAAAGEAAAEAAAPVAPNVGDPGITYTEKFGIVVACEDEESQKAAYKRLRDAGFEPDVLRVLAV